MRRAIVGLSIGIAIGLLIVWATIGCRFSVFPEGATTDAMGRTPGSVESVVPAQPMESWWVPVATLVAAVGIREVDKRWIRKETKKGG